MSDIDGRISVVIPVYGRPLEAARAVRSVENQAGIDAGRAEIVVVDDASPTPVTLGPVSRARIVRLARNGGPAAARNAGVAASTGAWIAFLDSDDVWLPTKLADQLAYLAAVAGQSRGEDWRTAAVCAFAYPERFTGRLQVRTPMAAERLSQYASGCWTVPGSALIVHREAFVRVGPQDESLRRLEDYDWLFRFGRMGGRVLTAPAVGAVIAPSAGSKVEPVLAAIARIAAKYGPGGADAVEPAIWRRMRAYLELERGAALWGGGDKLRGGVALAQSMVLKPRLQGAVERFWDRGGYVSPDVEAAYRSLL